MEDDARKITKFLYGDNYDNSKYERILNCLNDFKKFVESFIENAKDLSVYYKLEKPLDE